MSIMELKILYNQIEKFLDDYTAIEKFKIGKTENVEDREDDYYIDGYNFVFPLCSGEKDSISQTEKDLIKYFTETSRHKEKCENEQQGGGSPNADTLYIAVKIKDPSVNDLNIKEYISDKYFSNLHIQTKKEQN